MDIDKLQKSIETEMHWKPETFCIKVFENPDDFTNPRTIDLMEFCPDEPEQHLKFGNTANVSSFVNNILHQEYL